MPGPKSPFGYDAVFHDLLARMRIDKPEQLHVKSDYKPIRLRALFNQFRSAWEKESEKFRKRKDFEKAQQFLENYYLLLRYSCTLSEEGIVLTNKTVTQAATIQSFGCVTTIVDTPFPFTEEVREIMTSPGDIKELERERARKEEENIRRIMGIGTTRKSAQVIPDNTPVIPPSEQSKQEYAFLLAKGKQPGSPEELQHWLDTGE